MHSKDEAIDFNNEIKNTDYFNSFKYKYNLLENIVAQPAPNQASGILKNAISTAPLKIFKQFLEITQNAIN